MEEIDEKLPYGKQEPELSKLTKQLYVREQHKNPFKKINYRDFLKNIKEICKIHHFDWTCKYDNGRRKYPSINGNAIHWCKNYDYPGAYRIYADLISDENYDELLRLNRILQDGEVRGLLEEKQNIRNQIHNLDHDDSNYSFELKRLLESYKLCVSLIDSELGLDVKRLEVNGNIKSENLNVEVKSTDEVLKEHEDSISRFISRRLKKTD